MPHVLRRVQAFIALFALVAFAALPASAQEPALFGNGVELAAFGAAPLETVADFKGSMVFDRLVVEPGASFQDNATAAQLTLILVENGELQLTDDLGLTSAVGRGQSQFIQGPYGLANDGTAPLKLARLRLTPSNAASNTTPAGLRALQAAQPTSTVLLGDIYIDPREFTVTSGSTITVVNTGVLAHSFNVSALGISTGLIQPGMSQTIVIDAAPGVYEVNCDVPGHTEAGQVATMTVEAGTESSDERAPTTDKANLPNGVTQQIIFETDVDGIQNPSSLFIARALFDDGATTAVDAFGGTVGAYKLRGEVNVERPDRLPSSFPAGKAIVFPMGYEANLVGVGEPRAIMLIAGIVEGVVRGTS
jgi:plastocyanin